jgi:hypothetical protein
LTWLLAPWHRALFDESLAPWHGALSNKAIAIKQFITLQDADVTELRLVLIHDKPESA